MNVIVQPVTGTVLSIKRDKRTGVILRGEPPKDGYWKVVWKRKPVEGEKEVSSTLIKRKAQALATVLNGLPRRDAILLVKVLHTAGAIAQVKRQSERKTYTGRSFEWPRS